MDRSFEIVVIGASAGGFNIFEKLLPRINNDFPLPIVIVQHSAPGSNDFFIKHFNENCALLVKEADEKETIKNGSIYFAPCDYHLLIEQDKFFSLTIDSKVNYSRPSIDVLFESAAAVYGSKTLGIIFTGANSDGTNGAKMIHSFGGFVIVQDPKTAESKVMPQSVISQGFYNRIMNLDEIIIYLNSFCANEFYNLKKRAINEIK